MLTSQAQPNSPLDTLEITIVNSFEADGLTLPNPLDVHIETLGEYALQNIAPYQASVRFNPPQAVPAWLDADYLTQMASNVDIGATYPRLIRDNLIDQPQQAALQQDFYIKQLHALLPMIALECKIRGIGGLDESGVVVMFENGSSRRQTSSARCASVP